MFNVDNCMTQGSYYFKLTKSYHFLVVFSFFEKTTYCCRARRLSVRPSVCPSVEIISFRGNSLSIRPIDLKIGLNVREGVVHVRKAWFFEIRIASCNFFAIYVVLFCVYTRFPVAGKDVIMLRNARGIVLHEPSMLVSTYTLHCTHPTH